MDDIFDFLNAAYEFITSGVYSLAVAGLRAFLEYWTLATIKASIWSLSFAWDISKSVLQDLNLSGYITSSWAALPDSAAQALSYFRLPEVINNLCSGLVMRLVMRYLPFL